MISVEIGGEGDLKKQMNESNKQWGGKFQVILTAILDGTAIELL